MLLLFFLIFITSSEPQKGGCGLLKNFKRRKGNIHFDEVQIDEANWLHVRKIKRHLNIFLKIWIFFARFVVYFSHITVFLLLFSPFCYISWQKCVF